MLSETLRILFVRSAGIGLAFLMTVLLGRFLGPEQYGLYCGVISLSVLMASLAPLGSERVLVRDLSLVRSLRDAARLTSVTHRCSAVTGMIMLTAIAGLWCFRGTLQIPDAWILVTGLAAVRFIPLLLTFLRQWVAIPLTGAGAAVLPEQLILPALFLPLICGLHYSGVELTAVDAALLNSGLLLTVWLISLRSVRLFPTYAVAAQTRVRQQELTDHYRGGLPFLGFSVGCTMLQRGIPLVVLLACGEAATGRFAIALQYAALAWLPVSVINLTMIPRCARSYQQGDMTTAAEEIRLSATLTFTLSCVIAVAVWLASPLFLSLLNHSYSEVADILPLLLLANVTEALSGSAIPVMQTMHLQKILGRSMVGFVPVQIALIFVGGMLRGAEGAAVGFLVARILWVFLTTLIIYRWRGIVSLPVFRFSRVTNLRRNPVAAA